MLRAAVGLACVAALLSSQAFAQRRKKNKKDEDFTQTLEVTPDPPAALTAETARLGFLVTPLTAKGLLSQQTRDALKWLMQRGKGSTFVRIRAYVAGTGDLRRIPSLVSEVFTEKKIALPVVTVVQVGTLPMEAAQVQLVATILEKKPQAGAGVAFLAAQKPALAQTLEELKNHPEAGDMLLVTCAVPGLENGTKAQATVAAAFPRAQVSVYQAQRSAAETTAACEGIARLPLPVTGGVQFRPNAVSVSAPRLVFAGIQLAFRYQEDDARLAFQRLEKTMQGQNSSLKQAVSLNAYPLSGQLESMVERIRLEFLDGTRLPAGTSLPYEGLPSMDASFGLEAVTIGSSAP